MLVHSYDNMSSSSPSLSPFLNDSNESSAESYEVYYPDFTQLEYVRALLITLHVIVMVLAIGGNAMVCIIVFRNKQMHTVFNYYIVNLSVCDLLVGVFVLPAQLLELTAPAHWGLMNDALCTVTRFLQMVVVFCSVFTLVVTCVERYLAIVYPLESLVHSTEVRAKWTLLVVWLLPCMISAPNLYQPSEAVVSTVHSKYGYMSRLTCFDTYDELHENFRYIYFMLLFVVVYVMPLTFIAGTCLQIARVLLRGMSHHRQRSLRQQEYNRRKGAKMVLVVVLAFTLCWTPYFVVTIVTQVAWNFMQHSQYFFTMLCVNLFAFLNSCANPFIYAVMNARFRDGFRKLLLALFCLPAKNNDTKFLNTAGTSSLAFGRRSLSASLSERSRSVESGLPTIGLRTPSGSFFHKKCRFSRLRTSSRSSRRTLSFSFHSGSSLSTSRNSKKKHILTLPELQNNLNESLLNGGADHVALTEFNFSNNHQVIQDNIHFSHYPVPPSKAVKVIAKNGFRNGDLSSAPACLLWLHHADEQTKLSSSEVSSPTLVTSQSFPNLSSDGSEPSSEDSYRACKKWRRTISDSVIRCLEDTL